MTKEEKSRYSEPEALRDILETGAGGPEVHTGLWPLRHVWDKPWERHHRYQRQGIQGHLLALRALIGLAHQYSRKAESKYMADIRCGRDRAQTW